MVVHHGLGRRQCGPAIRHPGHVLPESARRSGSEPQCVRAPAARVRARGACRSAPWAALSRPACGAGRIRSGADEGSTRAFIGDWSLADVGGAIWRRSPRAICVRFSFRPTQPPLARRCRRLAQGAGRAQRALLQRAATRGHGHGRRRHVARHSHRHRMARSRMVEHVYGAGSLGLGLDGDQPCRWRRIDGFPDARQGGRCLLGGRLAAARGRQRAHVRAGRRPLHTVPVLALAANRHRLSGEDDGRRGWRRARAGTADGRPGARLTREHGDDLLGRRGARHGGGRRRQATRGGLRFAVAN